MCIRDRSITRWEDYSRAKDTMMQFTDISDSPWYTVESDDKKTSRINVIAHLLSTVPYEDLHPKTVDIPSRPVAVGYHRPPRESNRYVPDHAHTLPILLDPKTEKAKAKKGEDKKDKGKAPAAAAVESAEPIESVEFVAAQTAASDAVQAPAADADAVEPTED